MKHLLTCCELLKCLLDREDELNDYDFVLYHMIGNKFTFRGIPNGTGFSSAVYIDFGNEKPKK